MSLDVSLIIACYNEALVLEPSIRRIFSVLDLLQLRAEVIFVDDASQDGTTTIIRRIIAANPHRSLQMIAHRTNVGRGGTVTDGIRSAQGRLVGFLDIDLEVDALYIPACVAALEEGYDVATARRIYRFYWRSLNRYAMSRGYHHLVRTLLKVPLEDTETGFKFFRRDAILPILDATRDTGWFWDTEIMVRAHLSGLRIAEIPALFLRRFDKPSSLQPWRDSVMYLKKLWRFRPVAESLRRGHR